MQIIQPMQQWLQRSKIRFLALGAEKRQFPPVPAIRHIDLEKLMLWIQRFFNLILRQCRELSVFQCMLNSAEPFSAE